METVKLYIDIQSLLDIRQGLLSYHLDQKTLIDYINSDEYNFRDQDLFQIHRDVLDKTLNEKDKAVITRSIITYNIVTIKQQLLKLEKRNTYYNQVKAQEVVINTYPFILTEKEQDSFINAVFNKLGMEVYISLICIPTKDVTPDFIKNRDIAVLFIYNTSEWLDHNSNTLNFLPLSDVIIYFPAILPHKPNEDEFKEANKGGYGDPFAVMEAIMKEVVKLQFLPIFFYTNQITATKYIEKYVDLNKGFTMEDIKNDCTSTEI